MPIEGPLLLVGGGRMGTALLNGWLARGLAPEAVIVIEPDKARAGELRRSGVTVHAERRWPAAGARRRVSWSSRSSRS